MRKKRKVPIQIDGKWYEGTFLGKGKYSTVFQLGNRAIIYTKDDCAKETLARFQQTRMMHIPEVVRHDDVTIGKTYYNVFSSPFYKNVTKNDGSAYRLAKAMINFYVDHYAAGGARVGGKRLGVDIIDEFIDDMEQSGEFPASVIKALRELRDVSSNCGSQIGFDFHMQNFGVNEYGVLIFRDLVNPLTHEYR